MIPPLPKRVGGERLIDKTPHGHWKTTTLIGALGIDGVRCSTMVDGATVEFLPPYSPDLNPIEMVFSKIQQALRSLACRTRDQLWRSMQGVLDTVTPSDAANCFRHCGYTLHVE